MYCKHGKRTYKNVDSASPSEKDKRTLDEFGEGIGPYNSNLPASDSESSKHTDGKCINPVSIKSKDCWSEGSIME